jgi:phosphoenolpyruvate phosphomutase
MSERTRDFPSKGAALRRLFASPTPIVIAGAHDGLTARLVEEAGFDGVWASGFEISASHGVPDASILTMTDTLAASRIMADAVKVPVIADCDTGFGNSINAIRTVQAFEAAGMAGLCIEDNVFPKRCSFYPGVKRLLADIDEHALKIRAAINAGSRDFVVIARTEALIAGWGLEEALRRGRAYADRREQLHNGSLSRNVPRCRRAFRIRQPWQGNPRGSSTCRHR